MILLPYVNKTRKDLLLPDDQPALVIFDHFRGQCIDTILSLLDSNHLWLAIVPANCTDSLQPLDVSVNKPAKEFLRRKFQQWYLEEVRRQIQSGKAVKVNLAMSVVKPLGAQWLIALDEYMQSNPSLITNGIL